MQLKFERPGKTPKKVWALVVPKKKMGRAKNKDTKEVKIFQKKNPKMHTKSTTQVFKNGHKKNPMIEAKQMEYLLRKGLKKRPKIEVRKKTMRKSVKMLQNPKVVKKAFIYRSPEHRLMVIENLKKSRMLKPRKKSKKHKVVKKISKKHVVKKKGGNKRKEEKKVKIVKKHKATVRKPELTPKRAPPKPAQRKNKL